MKKEYITTILSDIINDYGVRQIRSAVTQTGIEPRYYVEYTQILPDGTKYVSRGKIYKSKSAFRKYNDINIEF